MTPSYVVTGGARGIGAAIADRLRVDGHVVTVDLEPSADPHAVTGDATSPEVVAEAAARASALGPLAGWVNNAAVFRDEWLHVSATDVLDLVTANLAPAVVGSAEAVRRWLAEERGGAIVNVSSHQASRAVRGALPYATAKAAVEGLTRALAVDYGPRGIRANAVALGSVRTTRPLSAELAALHPVGRVGEPAEVASAVAYLLSAEAGFVNGAVVPVDGGRAAQGHDPEARKLGG